MHVIRVRKRVESETLHLPELKEWIGKDVEIIVLEERAATAEPAAGKRDYSALAEIAGKDLIDPEAYKELRAASMI